MYSPNFYRSDDRALIEELLHAESFAAMITPKAGHPVISHLPFLLDTKDSEKPRLVSHMARANPHWKEFAEHPQTTLVYQGPHAYISPAWYQPKPDNVPTWNYAVAHVRGTARIIVDRDASYAAMKTLVDHFEKKYGTGWSLPQATNDGIEGLLRAIIVFEITDLEFEAKFKLSQKHDDTNRKQTIEGLKRLGQTEVAQYMEKFKSIK